MSNKLFGFETAMEWLKIGEYVRRSNWVEECYLKLIQLEQWMFIITHSNGMLSDWQPDAMDILAEDWCLYRG